MSNKYNDFSSEDIALKTKDGFLSREIQYLTKNSQNYNSKDVWNEYELMSELDENKLMEDLKYNECQNSVLSEQKILILDANSTENEFNFDLSYSNNEIHIIDQVLICFQNGELENWNDIFNSKIDFLIGGCLVNTNSSFTMEYNLLLNKLMDQHIVRDDSNILIPLSQMNMLINNFKKYTKFDGFNCCILKNHSIKFAIYSKDISYLKNVAKLIIIKIKSNEQDFLNIHKINLYLNFCSPITYNIYDNEIIEINNFGNKFFVIALSPSFKNSKNLCDNLKFGNLDKYGINFTRINDVSLEILDVKDEVEFELCTLHANVVQIMDGMIGTKYC